jgi:hypothetical protein
MVTEEAASAAQEALSQALDNPPWLWGVCLFHDSEGSFFLRVHVAVMDEEIVDAIPASVLGVPVEILQTKRLVPLPADSGV